jgi:hypothetical protein
MDDGQERDRALSGCGLRGRSLDRLQLAAARSVDDVPAAFTQAFADGVGRGEIACAAQLDAPLQKLPGLGFIRSFWL